MTATRFVNRQARGEFHDTSEIWCGAAVWQTCACGPQGRFQSAGSQPDSL